MSCYKPVAGFRTPTGVVFSELSRHDILGRIDIPCGQCIGCRMQRASDWSLRIMHEASGHDATCFVTLTYGRDALPPNSSLAHEDFQKFMKRLRKHFGVPVRFFMCGEYGPLNQRPHYHACLFGVAFSDAIPDGRSDAGEVYYNSPLLSKLWTHGRVSVQPLTPETASYCARYIMKKILGPDAKTAYSSVDEDGVVSERRAEYACMSLKPGIGFEWFKKFGRDVYPHDFVIQGGSKKRPPKYYDKLLKRNDAVLAEDIKMIREKNGRRHFLDNTDERLSVREQVHLARVKSLHRSDV
ncbi:MAG: replication initiator protein [Arizlama microvirus]|nr:MAG: replication initiator protein [Arizlama microvirus]